MDRVAVKQRLQHEDILWSSNSDLSAGDHRIMDTCQNVQGGENAVPACHLERSVAESKPEGQMQGIWISRKNQYPLTNKGIFSYLRDPTFGRPTGFDYAQDDNARVIPQLSNN